MSRFKSHLALLLVAAVVALTALNIKSVANNPPVGVDDNFQVAAGGQLVVDAPGLLVNDVDPDGDQIASGFHSDPDGGRILAMTPDGAFIYEPDPGFVGVDSFAYAVRDDLGSVNDRVDATIIVTAATEPTNSGVVPNAPPVGVDDTFEVGVDRTLEIAAPGVIANDSDPEADPISVALISATSNGKIVAKEVGSFRYTPDPGFTGVDSFRYAVEDDQGRSTGLVVDAVITVTPTSPGVGLSPLSADPGNSTSVDSAGSPSAWKSSSGAVPDTLAVTGTTSEPLIPAILLAVGLIVIAFGVRRAMNGAD
jgi:Bacterial Ig domain